MKHLTIAALLASLIGLAAASAAPRPERRLHPRRRPRLRRARLLRAEEDPHPEHRPARRPGAALHPALLRRPGVRPVALRPDDRQAPRPRGDPRQPPSEGQFPEFKDGGQHPITADAVTIAEVFQEAGYATGRDRQVGARPVGSTGDPNNQGFDLFYGYNCQASPTPISPALWDDDKHVTSTRTRSPATASNRRARSRWTTTSVSSTPPT